MKNLKTSAIIGIIVVFAITGIAIAYSLYNKPHRQAGNEAPDMEVEATKLFNDYVSDEAGADSLYLDKVLQVNGVVKEILNNEQGEKVLMLQSPDLFGISCTMTDSTSDQVLAMKPGTQVTIKGICNGMLMDVVLVKCVLVEK